MPASHAVCSEAPVASTKDPASASLQLDWPASSWYVPTTQEPQLSAAEPLYLPASHGTCFDAPSESTKKPASASLQFGLPVSSWYVPPPPVGLVQISHSSAPGPEYDPAEQLAHSLAPAAEKVPAAHFVHCGSPSAEKVPASHDAQFAML